MTGHFCITIGQHQESNSSHRRGWPSPKVNLPLAERLIHLEQPLDPTRQSKISIKVYGVLKSVTRRVEGDGMDLRPSQPLLRSRRQSAASNAHHVAQPLDVGLGQLLAVHQVLNPLLQRGSRRRLCLHRRHVGRYSPDVFHICVHSDDAAQSVRPLQLCVSPCSDRVDWRWLKQGVGGNRRVRGRWLGGERKAEMGLNDVAVTLRVACRLWVREPAAIAVRQWQLAVAAWGG